MSENAAIYRIDKFVVPDAARAVVKQAHAERGFSPRELMERLGIEADIADYRAVSV